MQARRDAEAAHVAQQEAHNKRQYKKAKSRLVFLVGHTWVGFLGQ